MGNRERQTATLIREMLEYYSAREVAVANRYADRKKWDSLEFWRYIARGTWRQQGHLEASDPRRGNPDLRTFVNRYYEEKKREATLRETRRNRRVRDT